MSRDLEPALPAPPMVTNNKYGGNTSGKGLSSQKGASQTGKRSSENVIPMGRPMANSPGKGLGRTKSAKY